MHDKFLSEARRKFMLQMHNLGIPDGDAVVLFDLSVHAAKQAQEATERVINTAPDHLQVFVATFAYQLNSQFFEHEAVKYSGGLSMIDTLKEKFRAEEG